MAASDFIYPTLRGKGLTTALIEACKKTDSVMVVSDKHHYRTVANMDPEVMIMDVNSNPRGSKEMTFIFDHFTVDRVISSYEIKLANASKKIAELEGKLAAIQRVLAK
jgi:hypothetical protein